MLLLLRSFLHASLVKQVQAKLWFMIKVKGQGRRCLEVDRGFSQRQFTDGFNLQEKVIFLHNRLAPQLQKKKRKILTHPSSNGVAHVTGTSTDRQKKRNRGRCCETYTKNVIDIENDIWWCWNIGRQIHPIRLYFIYFCNVWLTTSCQQNYHIYM